MAFHRLLAGDNLHSLHRWSFTDENERTTVSGVTSEDLGKLGWQQSDDTFWMLVTTDPHWIPLSSTPFATKNSNFTAEPYRRYAVDVSSNPITILLPATPEAGWWFEFYDATANSDTNNITLDGNGNNIMGSTDDVTISTAGLYFKIVYFNTAGGYRVMRLV